MNSNKTFIIAELSANHNNNFDIAVKSIAAIAKTGADAVKIQTYTADSLTLDVNNEYFGPRKEGLWKGQRPYEVFKEGALPYEWHDKLQVIAKDLGLIFFSSPFDKEGADLLEKIQIPIYKIASFEITDIPLIEYVAKKMKPMIISTGVAELCDIELAVQTCRNAGNNDITLLKCTSEYPAPFEKANLLTIPNLKNTFNVKVGVSDHTMGSTIPILSIALGATVIEKHFILDRQLGGPDASFSMEPDEFSHMVKSVREAEVALGSVNYEVSENSKQRRRSLFISNDIKKGEIITTENIKSVRPGNGLHPKNYKNVIGKVASKDLKKGEPLKFNMILND
jgi:pseudaminic acid synthase